MSSYIPSEITEQVLERLGPQDTINYCLSTPHTMAYCNSPGNKIFWLRKLDNDLTINLRIGGGAVRTIVPSHYVDANDISSGYEIYQRFVNANTGENHITQALSNNQLDVAEWLTAKGFTKPGTRAIKLFINQDNVQALDFMIRHGEQINWYDYMDQILRTHNILIWLLQTNTFQLDQLIPDIKPDILIWLLQNNIVATTLDANTAVQTGRVNILDILALNNVLPDVSSFKYALSTNNISTATWLFQHNLYPNIEDVNASVEQENTTFIEWLLQYVMPDSRVFNALIIKQDINTIQYLLQQGLMPNQQDINLSVQYDAIFNLFMEWGLYPDTDGANLAADRGNEYIVRILLDRGIYPNSRGANNALLKQNLKMVKLLMDHGITPDEIGYETSIKTGSVNTWMWLKKQGITLNEEGRELAMRYRRNDIIQVMDT